MGRPPSPPQTASPTATTASATASPTTTPPATRNYHVLHTIRDRFLSKRNPNTSPTFASATSILPSTTARHHRTKHLHHHHHHRNGRKGIASLSPFRATCLLYFLIVFSISAFVIVSLLLQTSIGSNVFSKEWGSGGSSHRRLVREGLKLGSTLKFVPGWRLKGVVDGNGLDEVRLQPGRVGIRAPRLAIVSPFHHLLLLLNSTCIVGGSVAIMEI